MTGVQCSVYFFSFFFKMKLVKGRCLSLMSTCMNILYMCWVFLTCFTTYDWSLEVMSQVIKSGNVLTKEKKKKKKEYLSIRWPWEKNLKFCIVTVLFFFFFLLTTMQITIAEDFEAFCILDCRSVQQSTLFCSPQVKRRCHFFGLNLYCGLDFLWCNENPV